MIGSINNIGGENAIHQQHALKKFRSGEAAYY